MLPSGFSSLYTPCHKETNHHEQRQLHCIIALEEVSATNVRICFSILKYKVSSCNEIRWLTLEKNILRWECRVVMRGCDSVGLCGLRVGTACWIAREWRVGCA